MHAQRHDRVRTQGGGHHLQAKERGNQSCFDRSGKDAWSLKRELGKVVDIGKVRDDVPPDFFKCPN